MSEADATQLLVRYGVPFAFAEVVATPEQAVRAAERIGYPVVVKLNGERIAHKTERGLVRLGLRDGDAVREAATTLFGAATTEDGDVSVLVAQQLTGVRELIAGVVRDPQFGATVMLGLGGVLAEAIGDVAFRLAPLTPIDANELIDDLATQKILEPFRGEPAIDREALSAVLLSLSRLACERADVVAVDLNPLIVCSGRPIAVDALVELDDAPLVQRA